MASLTKDGDRFRIQFLGTDKKRRSIWLGKMNVKTAREVKLRVEHLHSLNAARLPMDSDTAGWVGKIGDDLARKLAAAGLIPARESRTLGGYLEAFIERRRPTAKPATIIHLGLVVNDLNNFFGTSTDLRAITEERADDFKNHLQTREPRLAAATVARRLTAVRMLFRDAVRWKAINANPFAHVSARSSFPEDRKHYITVEDTRKLLAACAPEWRMIIALARLAGLRCPSEVLSLKWSHVNFETNRITAPSPKTEHLEGKAYRTLPIFAELRPYLEEAFDLAEGGAVYVVAGNHRAASNGPGGWANCNLRTQLLKIIRRAGLKPWPRLFHNLRASCETDLMRDFPINVVVGWLGNTPGVALKHYLQTLDRDFDKAVQGNCANPGSLPVQKAAQSGTASFGLETTIPTETACNVGSGRVVSSTVLSHPSKGMGVTGLEPIEKTAYFQVLCPQCSAESGSLSEDGEVMSLLVASWPSLSAEVRSELSATLKRVLLAVAVSSEK